MCFQHELSALFGVAAHCPSSFPHPFPPSFHCLFSVMGAFSLSWVGAHGWIARICQPWEKSPSRSWLPVVIAPGCLRHPTSTWWCSWLQHAPQSFSNWWSQQYVVGLPNMNLINIQTYNKCQVSVTAVHCKTWRSGLWCLFGDWSFLFVLCLQLIDEWLSLFIVNIQF